MTHWFPDVDECSADPQLCDQNAECYNVIGSYTCKCETGFTGNGKTCAGNKWRSR